MPSVLRYVGDRIGGCQATAFWVLEPVSRNAVTAVVLPGESPIVGNEVGAAQNFRSEATRDRNSEFVGAGPHQMGQTRRERNTVTRRDSRNVHGCRRPRTVRTPERHV